MRLQNETGHCETAALYARLGEGQEILGKRKRGSLLSAHSTLKAADILENNVLREMETCLCMVRTSGPILIDGGSARISPRGREGGSCRHSLFQKHWCYENDLRASLVRLGWVPPVSACVPRSCLKPWLEHSGHSSVVTQPRGRCSFPLQ